MDERQEEAVDIMQERDIPVISASHLATELGVKVEEAEEVLDELISEGVVNGWYVTRWTRVCWLAEENN